MIRHLLAVFLTFLAGVVATFVLRTTILMPLGRMAWEIAVFCSFFVVPGLVGFALGARRHQTLSIIPVTIGWLLATLVLLLSTGGLAADPTISGMIWITVLFTIPAVLGTMLGVRWGKNRNRRQSPVT